jgi:antitoxin component HigA of HigAB toxin-antitoxin module
MRETIQTAEDHLQALARLEELMMLDSEEGSAQELELEGLAKQIDAYERVHFPITEISSDS